uniref:EF-hand domain family member B n=1 Tax=Fundulus heteroclitus TaxID=8078 RepID=A0A3Q2P5C9_FUNHE
MNFTDGNVCCQLREREKNQNTPRPAGKLKPIGDRAKSCLQEIPHPPTPPVLRKFRRSTHPEPGAIAVPQGKANDPDVASTLVHGISTKPSLSQGDGLINLPQKTFFQQKLQEDSESIYASRRKAPLGRGPVQDAPAWYNDETTFGVKTVKGLAVREILNPPVTTEELEKEAHVGHEAYIRSHNSYFVGEQIDRKYNRNKFNKNGNFGIATPHFSDGRNLGKTLRWVGESHKLDTPNASWKRSGNKEKLALQMGITSNNLCRGRNALPVPPEHTFGVSVPADQYGAGEIIHSAEPGEFVRGVDWQRSLVNAVRHLLKKANFHHFPTLMKAFRHYDKKGKGLIDKEDLQAVCHEFNLKPSDKVLHDLMEYCDTDKDGFINFTEFANFLNWKDKMPISDRQSSSAPVHLDRKPSSESDEPLSSHTLIRPEDLEPLEPGSSQKTVRTIRRPKAALGHFCTSASVIGANSEVQLTSNDRAYGIPSMRTDLPAPRIKRISDRINYGDLSTAAELLHPSVHALRGVHEEHFFCPRSKKEIEDIFRNIGVDISEETFEEAWKLASMKQPNGEVCVEVFRNTLKEIKAM